MSVISKLLWHRVTGAAAIASTLAPTFNFVLVCIKLHMSATGGAVEDFTVAVDSNAGAAYDVILLTQGMNAVADIYWPTSTGPGTLWLPFVAGDEIDFAYVNTNTRTYGLEVGYRREV